MSRNGNREFVNLVVGGTATPGDQVNLGSPGSVSVTAEWIAKQSYTGTIEIVKNGEVVASLATSAGPGSPATLATSVPFDASGWLAARRMGPEGHVVHTAAVFVIVAGAPIRASATDAQFYIDWMDNLLERTSPGGSWASFFPTKRVQAQARYQAAKTLFQQILAESSGSPTLTVVPPTNGTVTGSGINCGTGGSDCTETYAIGAVVPLTATPDSGYTFGGWTGACTGTGACSVTMTVPRTVGATFTPPRFTLTVTPPTGGTITATGINCGTGGSDCTQDYDQGTVVPLTATPATGYTFGGWTGNCSGTGACSVTMTAARTVGATFTIQRFTLTVNLPANGTITGSGINCGAGGSDCTQDYDYGTAVPLTATPSTGYMLGGWTGNCSGTGACSVTMTAPRTVGATFTIQRFTLTVTPPTGGTITATGINCGAGGSDCSEGYDSGTVVALTQTPSTGYTFGGWTGNCSGTGACSVTMTAARTVGATFTHPAPHPHRHPAHERHHHRHRHQLRHGRQRLHPGLRLQHRRPPHRDPRHRLQPQHLDGSLHRHQPLLRDHDPGPNRRRHLRHPALHAHRHPAHERHHHRHRHQLRHRRHRLHPGLRLRHRRPPHRHPEHRLQPERLDRRLHRHRSLLAHHDPGEDRRGHLRASSASR